MFETFALARIENSSSSNLIKGVVKSIAPLTVDQVVASSNPSSAT